VIHGGFGRGWMKRSAETERAGRAWVELVRVGWGTRASAYRRMFAELFIPTLSGILTDAFGVLVVMLVPIVMLRKLAIVASWWILAITISEMLLNPIVYYYLRAPDPEVVLAREKGWYRALIDRITDWNLSRPGKIATLVFWTEKNPGTGPDVGRKIASLIPNGEFYCMDDAAHWPQWEQPETHDGLVADFLAETPPLVATLRAAASAEAVHAAAHTLKGLGATFGATAMARLCQDIEAHAGAPAALVAEIVAEHERVVAALQVLV